MTNQQVNLTDLRERALKALEEGKESSLLRIPNDGADVRKLIEELRVYQEELEIQNLELRVAQRSTGEAMNKYRLLFDRLPLPAVLVDDRGFILEANLCGREFLRLSKEIRLQHRSVGQLFHFEDRSALYRVLNKTEAAGPEMLQLMRLKLGEEPVLPCDVHFIHPRNGGNEPEPKLLVFVDQSAKQQLSESELRYRYVMEATGDGIWDWDRAGDNVTHNSRWYEILGLPEHAGGYSMEDYLGLVHEESRDAVREALHGDGVYSSQHRMCMAGGRVIWVLDRGKVVERDVLGRPLRMVGSLIEVTVRVEQERELVKAKMAAEVANVAKSRFLATMSHELRTPLNGILGMAQLLQEQDLSEVDRVENVETLLASGHTLNLLLNDILDLSKVEAGRMPLNLTTFAPELLMAETCRLFAAAAKHKTLNLAFEWKGVAGAYYRSDAMRVQQMLVNYVSNALKFTTEGRIQLVAQEVEREGNRALVEFSVTDTGIGISKAHQENLFYPFSQVAETLPGSNTGTGLGLSLVLSFANLLGGTAGVESEPGKGARFWFRIQAEVAAGDPNRPLPPGISSPASGSLAQPPLSGRVLIVEDNPVNSKIALVMLQKMGISAEVVENGELAVRKVLSEPRPDLVLMDIQMPVMDGLEATRRIRDWEAQGNRSRMPIIALTANAYPEDQQKCLEAGLDDFLPKPINLGVLRERLRAWLRA